MGFSLSVRTLGQLGTNCVVVANSDTRSLLVFDAPRGVGAYLSSEFPGHSIAALLLTHGHFDHIMGVGELSAPAIYAHDEDGKLYRRPQVMSAWMSPDDVPALSPVAVTHWLRQAQTLTLEGLPIDVLPTPGHSAGSVCFHLPTLGAAIVGDTIFQGSVGRTDLPSGSAPDLLHSIRTQILTLPPATVLYPGHGPKTTVANEAATNPFLFAAD